MTRQKDYAISFTRLVALLLIITCHICQFYENELAWWFNVGVQVFLIISGFLYGGRKDIHPVSFYKRNLPKVLVDYYLYLILIVPVYLFIVKYHFKYTDFIKLLFGIGTKIPGLGHLWFISTILICYLITPILLTVIKKHRGVFPIVLCGVVVEIICMFLSGITGAWINCYIIGLAYGYFYNTDSSNNKVMTDMLKLTIPPTGLLVGVEVFIKYIYNCNLTGIINRIANTIFHYGHIGIAIIIFSVIVLLMHKSNSSALTNNSKILDFSDKYSYDIYLCRLFFVLGPYSLFIGKNSVLSIGGTTLVLLYLSIICAWLLKQLSDLVRRIKLN